MRGSKAKRIRKAVYGDVSPRISREPGSVGDKLRKRYQQAKRETWYGRDARPSQVML